MSLFKGAAVAIVTPMNADGSVNYENLDKLIEFQIANSTDAIVICGTTGESATLSEEEHIDVIRHCIKTVNKRVPVIAGTGSNCTKSAIELSVEAQEAGADGLLCVTPYYNKATQGGLYVHFKAIADAVNIPIILYNVPSRTGTNILPETAVKLCKEVENIVGIKEASGNISQVAKLMQLADGCVDLYSGNDDQIIPILSLGGKGVISVLSNVAPKQTHDICQAFFDGDTAKAAKLQLDAIPVIDSLFCEVNPIPVKKALELQGFEVGPLRLPLTEMEAAHAKELADNMKAYGIL